MNIPIALFLFVLGLIVSLITYIWTTHAKRIDKLEKLVVAADLEKCHHCDPITIEQVTSLFDARFNEFRLELYQSGVLKPKTSTHNP